jgi:hypothetical protein
MRTIETKMNHAILGQKDLKIDNTKVENIGGISKVYLHGNLIAEIGDNFLTLYDGGGFRTPTTKSRLNAILACHGNGEYIFQRRRKWFISLNGQIMPFVSGLFLG